MSTPSVVGSVLFSLMPQNLRFHPWIRSPPISPIFKVGVKVQRPKRMACAAYHQEKSVLGEKLPNLKSAIQKYIRRGNLAMAQYSAGQLLSFILAPEEKKWGVLRNVLHRIMIITLEDAGQCPGLILTVEAFRANFDVMIDDRREDLLPMAADRLAEVVELLVRAPKSRACSHSRTYGRLYKEAPATPALLNHIRDAYPDIFQEYIECMSEKAPAFEAMVKYTEQRSPKAYVFFWTYWEGNTGIRERREIIKWAAAPFGTAIVDALITWLNGIRGLGDAFMCALAPIIWRISGYDDSIQSRPQTGALAKYQTSVYTPLDTYILDKHTGIRTGMDASRFVLEGAHVENESPKVDARLRNLYVGIRVFQDAGSKAGVFTPPVKTRSDPAAAGEQPSQPAPSQSGHQPPRTGLALESREFQFVVRAQLTTSNAKQDSYAADHPSLGRVFVKGPFLSSAGPQVALAATEWKKSNGIPTYRCVILNLVPDMWPNGLPLGLRNTIDRAISYPFLVTEALTDVWPPPRRIHESKVWPPTEVLENDRSWDPVAMWDTATEQARADYIMGICSRMVLGIGDLADRNFCLYRGRVYSIDEDMPNPKEIDLVTEIRGEKKIRLITTWVAANAQQLHGIVTSWTKPTSPCLEGADSRVIKLLDALKRGSLV
jgi:hypothetical protein